MRNVRFRIRFDWLAYALLLCAAPFVLPHFNGWGQIGVFLAGLVCFKIAFYNRARGTYGNAFFQGVFWGIVHGVADWSGIPIGSFLWLPLPVAYKKGLHAITIAPNGSGKGACVQIPVLLSHSGSVLINDPKAENAIVTAKYRRDTMKHRVYVLNPFNILQAEFAAQGFTSARFNPLATLDPTNSVFTSQVDAISAALIEVGKDPFWDNAARDLISCFVMYVCLEPSEPKTLPNVRRLLQLDQDTALASLFQYMARSPFAPLAQRIQTFIGKSKTNDAIFSTARNQTAWLDVPVFVDNLGASDFSFADLKSEGVTVYLCVPAEMMATYAKWFRLLLTCGINDIIRAPRVSSSLPWWRQVWRWLSDFKRVPVLFLVDEAPVLGRLEVLLTAMGLARGFGVQIWTFWQNLNQITANYDQSAETFFANAGLQQYFTPNDQSTAEHISDACGFYTEEAISQRPDGTKVMERQTQRLLVSPTELRGMPDSRQIVFFKGIENPFLIGKTPYFQSWLLQGRAMPNPYV